MELLPIGTVIKKDGILLVVMGYDTNKKESSNYIDCYYYVSIFPFGVVEKNSLFLIPFEEYEVVFKGFFSEEDNKYLRNKQEEFVGLSSITVDKISEFFDALINEQKEN